MKTKMWKMLIAIIVILPMALVSCHDEFIMGINGQGEIVEETIDLNDFDGFVSAISADIYLTQGDKQEVVIKAQQNIIDNIDLSHVENGIWTIHYDQNVSFSKPVKIYITIPTLTKAGVSGSGYITGLTSFTGLDQLKLFITGSGGMDLETQSKDLDINISGSGDLKMAGTTDKLDLTVTGSGSFHASDLLIKEADLTITGSGGARLTVEEYLHVQISGSGNVWYYGNPDVEVHVTGSGSVIKGH